MYYPFVNCQFCNSLPAFACRRSQCRLAKGCRRPVVLGRADAGGRDVRHLSRRRPRSDHVPPLLYPSTDRMCIFPHQNHSPGRSSWTRRALGSSTGTPHRRRPGEARRSWGGGGVTGGGDLETTVCGRRICQEEKFYHRTHHTQGLGKKKTGAGHGPAGIKKLYRWCWPRPTGRISAEAGSFVLIRYSGPRGRERRREAEMPTGIYLFSNSPYPIVPISERLVPKSLNE
jgi:hypothetical protein